MASVLAIKQLTPVEEGGSFHSLRGSHQRCVALIGELGAAFLPSLLLHPFDFDIQEMGIARDGVARQQLGSHRRCFLKRHEAQHDASRL
jgi:hypothetical protein